MSDSNPSAVFVALNAFGELVNDPASLYEEVCHQDRIDRLDAEEAARSFF